MVSSRIDCLSTVLLFTLVINAVSAVPGLKDSTDSAISSTRLKKRSYYPWAVSGRSSGVPTLYNNAANQIYKPSPYTISRPYYIPVYGLTGGNLLFYPPQPLYSNVGAPPDNPAPPTTFQGPAYLPPNKETPPPKQGGSGGGAIDNRFGEDDDDDRPVWGAGGMNSMPLSGDQPKEYAITPTRPPAASLRPAPPLIRDPPPQAQSIPSRPSAPQPPSIGGAPSPSIAPGPSNCVWAIISCCSGSNPSALPHSCFEARGCPGPFWGSSPCEGGYAQAAIDSAVKYFGQG